MSHTATGHFLVDVFASSIKCLIPFKIDSQEKILIMQDYK